MLTVRNSIYIAASPGEVFKFLDAPERQPSFTPSLVESTLIERLPNGGARARYVFAICGFNFEGEVYATDYDPSQRIVWTMSGDLQGTIRWYFDSEDDGTRFTYAATYRVPVPTLLRPLAKPFVRRYNEREVQVLLENLKRKIEARAQTAA